MTSLSAKARKVIRFLGIIVIEKESAKKAYLQWKNDNKNVNKGSQKYCVFINDNNISNTLKFPSAILEDFKVCIKVHLPVLFREMLASYKMFMFHYKLISIAQSHLTLYTIFRWLTVNLTTG